MEISEAVLRKIVRETVRELGEDAEPNMVRKIVKEVIRRAAQRPEMKAPLLQIDPPPFHLPPH